MSHVTDIKLKIHDLDALDEACEKLGLVLQRDKTTYAWWGTFVGDSRAYGEHQPKDMGHCAHAIKVAGTTPRNGSGGPWEIGVVPAKDGDGYQLYYDTYGGAGRALSDTVGLGANKLRQEYAIAVASRKAKATLAKRGWTLSRLEAETVGGTVRLRLRKR